MSDTFERLKGLLVSRLKLSVGEEVINRDTTLFGPGGLGLDSIDVLELVVGIKKEFGVDITDRETAEKIFTSVGAIVGYIDEQRRTG
ncbi:phosphopantetheine-binding protein [Candidatus Magnetominusculus dajiuhuensis]|uniref:phosphopantetheine-binding protein n=1 Tax=Candidatus Magnetominusculus dajiuhuensis TaxID=3137712 RepID=UPI003B42A97A